MKIAYITAEAPYGNGEFFVIDEMYVIKQLGYELVICPRYIRENVFHKKGKYLKNNVCKLPLINLSIVIKFFLLSFKNIKRVFKVFFKILFESRNLKIMVKNLIVLPKSVFLSDILKKFEIDHIHAHWGSTPSTMAWIAAELSGIPWSFTVHRWDIKENNLLKIKVKSAKFVRCISFKGKEEVLNIVGYQLSHKVKLLHLGVEVPKNLNRNRGNSSEVSMLTIVSVGRLVEVKGYKYLIEALSILINRGVRCFQCLIIGDGPLRKELETMIRGLRIEKFVKILGWVENEKIREMYKQNKVDIFVLPSITTSEGEKEGIPVSLMEAMSWGIPVVSTKTGSIPELLSEEAGILVEEKNSVELANVLETLLKNSELREKIGKNGFIKVATYFDLYKNVSKLINNFKMYNSL